jgi:hypothetical protein
MVQSGPFIADTGKCSYKENWDFMRVYNSGHFDIWKRVKKEDEKEEEDE